MAKLLDVIAYIIKRYPGSLADELSNARLTKLVYLSDWKSCLINDRAISGIDWYFDNHGPYVHDVIDTARENSRIFSVKETSNVYGGKKRIISLKDESYDPKLSKDEMKAIDDIIEITKKMYWSDFIGLVYGTYPITSSERYTPLNLRAKAREYLKSKAG